MTQAEKKLLQDTHDSIIELKLIIKGNGVEGLAETVKKNRAEIKALKDRFNKTYYKAVGGGFIIILLAEAVSKFLFR